MSDRKMLTNGMGSGTAILTTEYTSFDILGRVTRSKQTTDGVVYGTDAAPMTYTYNLSGALIEQQYPSGRVVKNTLDADGDLQQVQSRKANDTLRNYANAFTYTSAGAVSSMRLGNGKWESTQFNSRLQPTQIGLGSGSAVQNKLDLDYSYGTTQNNGNVLSQTITVRTVGSNNGFVAVQNYGYDSLNRLKDATENVTPNGGSASQSWKQTFTFDRYGNRNFDTANTTTIPAGCSTAVCNPTVDPATNKLVGYQFDNAGNTKVDANGQVFTYDAENKQVQVNNATTIVGQYVYDGDGKRIKKIVPSTGETTIFVYDTSGKSIAEYSTIVADTANAKIAYLTNDHLGSPRITTDATGQTISRRDFMPFGEEVARANYGSDSVRQKFTGYERDNEIGLDFAQARSYGFLHARFTSPDPLVASAIASTPQSWNRYVYCINNPMVFVDPSGLIWGRKTDKDGNQTGSPIWYKNESAMQEAGAGLFTEEYYRASDGQWIHLNMIGPMAGAGLLFDKWGWQHVEARDVPGKYSGANMPSVDAGPPDDTGALQLLIEYFTGAGPTDRQFGPDDYMTQGMQSSPDVDAARQNFIAQGGGTHAPEGVWFGWDAEDGPFESGFNMPRQFVGSFNITVTEQQNGDALFVMQNTTHLKSLLYGVPGIKPVERSTMEPLSSKTQTYFWIERGLTPRR